MSDSSADAKNVDAKNLEELLAGHVLSDLSGEEQKRLDGHSLTQDDRQTLAELETTMARVQLAFQSQEESMPESLRSRIANDAKQYLGNEVANPPLVPAARSVETDSEHAEWNQPSNQRSSSVRFREVIAWVSCAAAMLISIGLWNASPPLPGEVSLAELRRELLAEVPDTIKVEWVDGKHPFPDSVGGDVVWSNTSQAGFMRFESLPVNQPELEQYQLWIIDPQRDDEPIDGGVFDITDNGEVIVPINAKLRVLNPTAFAVTIEKPGGVVVSTQDRLPLLAAVQ